MTNEEKITNVLRVYNYNGRLTPQGVYGFVFDRCKEIAKWKDEQFESDRLFLEEYKSRCDFYQKLITYLHEDCCGKTDSIIETIDLNFRNVLIGYVDTEKEIDKKGNLIIKFKIDDKTYKAYWQENDNFAVCQWSGYVEDDYKGYILLPTFGFKRFLCIYYEC